LKRNSTQNWQLTLRIVVDFMHGQASFGTIQFLGPGPMLNFPAGFAWDVTRLMVDGVIVAGPDEPSFPGDFDGDGAKDVSDIDALTRLGNLVEGISSGDTKYDRQYDLNHDAEIDVLDIAEWLEIAALDNGYAEGYVCGDTDLNGVVDFRDFVALNNHWRHQIAAAGSSPASVPEPGANWLYCITLLATAVRRGRMRRRHFDKMAF
jgi:hypothetical protein